MSITYYYDYQPDGSVDVREITEDKQARKTERTYKVKKNDKNLDKKQQQALEHLKQRSQ